MLYLEDIFNPLNSRGAGCGMWIGAGGGWWHADRSWGPAVLDGWHADGSGLRGGGNANGSWGPRIAWVGAAVLDGWHADRSRGSWCWMDGTRIGAADGWHADRSWGLAARVGGTPIGLLALGWGLAGLDGWHVDGRPDGWHANGAGTG